MLVVDASQGGMAVESARVWSEDVGVSSLILTKLDGTAKGGSVIAVSKELGIPVKLVGGGEKIEDLKDFNAEIFVDAVMGGEKIEDEGLKERVRALREQQSRIEEAGGGEGEGGVVKDVQEKEAQEAQEAKSTNAAKKYQKKKKRQKSKK